MGTAQGSITIGGLAKASGVGVDTMGLYQRQGPLGLEGQILQRSGAKR